MRKRRSPFEGYTRDNDMVAFWRCSEATTPATIASSTEYGGVARHLIQFSASTVSPVSSLFGNLETGALNFTSDSYRTSTTGVVDDSSILKNNFSLAFWYDFASMSSATVGVINYAAPTAVSADMREYMGLYYDGGNKRFIYAVRTGGTNSILGSSPIVPTYGHIALSVTSSGSIAWYLNGALSAASSFTDVRSTISGSTIGRWYIGGNNAGLDSISYRMSNGTLEEVAVWDRAISEEKARELYASCVLSWDQQSLEDTNNHKTETRVLIEDSNGNMVDVTRLCDRNWLISAEISESVEEAASQARVVLRRNDGILLDLSPLNEPAYRAVLEDNSATQRLVDFRRRVKIERALIPPLWRIQGWEWELRFDGFIDAWDVDEEAITISCVDRGAPLIDQFIMDQRAYNFYTANKPMEEHIQQIINDNNPTIYTSTSSVIIGYKGGLPILYTEAGTAATAYLNNAAWNLRYNDVASGTVLSALQAVTDQIGSLIGYRFHEPWQEFRLETHFPKRSKSFQIQAVAPVSSGVEVTTFEPHGLNVGSIASVYGTSSLNFGGTVASVLDYYRIRFDGFTGGSTATETGGSLGFSRHVALSAQDVFSVNPVKSEIANVRNHAVVKYQRVDSLFSLAFSNVSTSAASSNLVFVTLPSTVDLTSIDPDKLGITFTISDCTTATFNSNYTGSIINRNTVRSNEPYPLVGSASASTGNFSCPYIAFQQVTSTATSSVNRYGLRPVGMYEGSNLAVSTNTEALRIANAFVEDLAEPTVDMSINTRIMDFRLGDLIELPNDPKGRWVQSSGNLTPAIVGIRERYESGKCTADYDMRHTRPTAGTKPYRRIQDSWGTAPANNNLHDVVNDSISWRVQAKRGRVFSFGFPRNQRRSMGLRDDVMETHISTASGFRPGPDTLVSKGRADHVNISQDGAGNPLTPGTTYYVRFRYLDIFGNPSQITGLNAASAATIPSFYLRYLDQRPEALITTCSVASTSYVGSTFTPWRLVFSSATDAASLSFDNFNNFSLTSSLWRCPTTGHYSITHRSYWLGGNVKPNGHYVVGRVEHLNGSASLLGAYSMTVASAGTFTDSALLSLDATVFCQSGDFLRVTHSDRIPGTINNVDNAWMVRSTTATTNYAYTSCSLTSES